jgi:hypothetical protein
MQKFVEFSSVVDSVRSNAGSALKSVQRTFEESALKAAGLGEDEEALYRLNKRAQAYLRATDAMQQAAIALADDFTEAIEDIALRDISRKFRDSSKKTFAQQLAALNTSLGEPVRKACEGDDYGMRQRLISNAFVGLIDVNLECFRMGSSLVEEVQSLAKTVVSSDKAKARSPAAAPAPAAQIPTAARRDRAQTSPNEIPTPPIARRNTAPPPASFDDLLGEVSGGYASKQPQPPQKGADLLDLGMDFGGSAVTTSVSGTSVPPERGASTSVPLDLDFGLGSSTPASAPVHTVSAPPSVGGFSLAGGLGDMSWPSKEDEDESCIKARVEAWQEGKNLRTMLVTLHEVTPSSAGWVQVQLGDVVNPSDVKSVYRKAVLAVHPDKHQAGKSGEKLLGHVVFEALREQWEVFRKSG